MPGRLSKTGLGRKIKNTSGMVLGKALQRDRVKKATQRRKGRHINTLGGMHTSELDADAGSITQTNSLADFLATAAMAERDFKAERGKVVVVGHSDSAAGYVDPQHLRLLRDIDKNEIRQLQIPKRPKFFKGQTPEEFDLAERTAFLDWRRRIAELEKTTKDAVATPFEKNLNMWRQLWRVIERSDVLVQIVDARNPLLYRSVDLEEYIDEIGEGKKRRLLILNKADFLSYELREQWARYFTSKGLDFVFFSAKLITEALEREIAEEKQRELEEAEQEALAALQKEISSLSTVPEEQPEGSELPSVEDSGAQNADNVFAALAEDDDEEDDEEEEEDQEDDAGQSQQPQKEEESKEPVPATGVEREQEPAAADDASAAATQSKEQGSNDESQKADPAASAAPVGEASGMKEKEQQEEDEAEALTAEEAEKRAFEARIRESTKILSRQEMLDMLEAFQDDLADQAQTAAGSSAGERKQITVGMIGFPNVGKSSCINALLGITATTHTKKRVAVAAQPGRTKHFQTLELTDAVVLCDCPGLVFPSFMNSKADMIINGILPLEQMRDYILPCAMITRRIPKATFNELYGLSLEWRSEAGSALTWVDLARQTLTEHATKRGFMVHTVGADLPRSARVLCKDYVSGKLLYCHSPPGFSTPASASYATSSSSASHLTAAAAQVDDDDANVVGNVTRESELFEQMDRTDELVVEGDGTELSFLSPQALKQLEKEKIIMEKKKLRQQKRQAKLNSGKGKIRGGRKSRGKDNPYGDNADDMFFDKSAMDVFAEQQLQNSNTRNYSGVVAKPATRGTATMFNAKVAVREAMPPKPRASGRR